jgi:hydroxymethylpyrimidine pyrophosphatase-like HAD family hydrolase
VSFVPRYRLLALDLDGTLLNAEREIPEANLRAIEAAVRAGVVIALVTGRRFPSVRRYLEPLGAETFAVANSGAIIRKGLEGPILRRSLLPLECAHRVLALAEEAGVEPVIHDGPDAEGHLYLKSSARTVSAMGRYLHQTFPAPLFLDSLRLDREPVQIGFTGGVEELRGFERVLEAGLASSGHRASLARTEYPDEELALLDVLGVDATKARALEFLAGLLEIDLASTMAVGDNWNDLDMLERAGLGVIMKNADPVLRSRGFAETGTNEECGVAEAIEKYLLGGGRE